MNKEAIEYIRQAAKDSGYTIQKIADEVGVSRQQMYNKLSGATTWTVPQFKAFCEVVGIPKKNYLAIMEKNFSFKVD